MIMIMITITITTTITITITIMIMIMIMIYNENENDNENEDENENENQSRSQSPRSSVRGIVGLWENTEENQSLIGCLIISLTHSLLVEIRAILIVQEAKYKLVYLTRLFIASLT